MHKIFVFLSVLMILGMIASSPAKAQGMEHSGQYSTHSASSTGNSSMSEMQMTKDSPSKGMTCSECSCCKGMCSGMHDEMMKEKMGGMQCKKMAGKEHKCGCCAKMMGDKKESSAYDHNDSNRYNQ